MVSSNRFFLVAKKLTLLLLIVAIAIPLRYGSTNPEYLIIRLIHSLMSIKHSLTPDQARPTLSAEYRAVESMLRMKPSLIIDTMIDPLEMAKKLRSSFHSALLYLDHLSVKLRNKYMSSKATKQTLIGLTIMLEKSK